MNTPLEIFLVDRLPKVTDNAIPQSASPIKVVGVGSHEDCRNRVPRFNEVSAELNTGHPRHVDVSNEAGGFNETRRREEIGCRRVNLDIVAQRSHEPSHGIAKGRIILNDRYQRSFRHAVSQRFVRARKSGTPNSVAIRDANSIGASNGAVGAMAGPCKSWLRSERDFPSSAPGTASRRCRCD